MGGESEISGKETFLFCLFLFCNGRTFAGFHHGTETEVTLFSQLNLLIFQWPVDMKIMSNMRVLKSTAKERRQVSNKLPIY